MCFGGGESHKSNNSLGLTHLPLSQQWRSSSSSKLRNPRPTKTRLHNRLLALLLKPSGCRMNTNQTWLHRKQPRLQLMPTLMSLQLKRVSSQTTY